MQYVIAFLLLLTWPAYAGVNSVGAIYATGSLLLQRIYIPDRDDSEIAKQFVGPGETMLLVPILVLRSGGIPAVQAAIGAPLISGRAAVVDKGTSQVIDVITADPALYSDPRGLVISSDKAMVGDTWTGTTFTRPFAQVSKITGKVVSFDVLPIDAPVENLTTKSMVVAPNAVIGDTVDPVDKGVEVGK